MLRSIKYSFFLQYINYVLDDVRGSSQALGRTSLFSSTGRPAAEFLHSEGIITKKFTNKTSMNLLCVEVKLFCISVEMNYLFILEPLCPYSA